MIREKLQQFRYSEQITRGAINFIFNAFFGSERISTAKE